MKTSRIADAMGNIDDSLIVEAADREIRSLPEYTREYSPLNEKKFKRALKKKKHPVFYGYIKPVLCAAGLLILAGVSILAFNKDARAMFLSWIFTETGDVAAYRFVGEKIPENTKNSLITAADDESENQAGSYAADETVHVKYELASVPDGYYLSEIITDDGINVDMLYIEANGKCQMMFSYYSGSDAMSLNIFNYSERKIVKVGNCDAVFYLGKNGDNNSLVWFSESGDICFLLYAPFSEETLIEMAESIDESK